MIEAWYAIMRCIRDAEMRTRCKALTWQELSSGLPGKLQEFLAEKYGIFGGEYKGDYGLVPAAMMADYLCGRPADLTDRRRVDPNRCRRLAFRQWVGRGIANRRQLDLTRPPR